MDATTLASAALGSVVGLILALTGAGGAIVAVPLLVFGLGLGVAQAAPIGLFAVALAAGIGALLALREGAVRYKAAALMAATGAVISPAGLWVAHRVPDAPLTLVFALVMARVAWRMFWQKRGQENGAAHAQQSEPCPPDLPCRLNLERGKLDWTAPCARALALSGAMAGFLSGLLGVGGGFVIVPALKRASDIPMQGIVATSLAVIALVSMAGVAVSAASGHMLWLNALPFAAGALAGMLGGRGFARHVSGARLQQSFAVFAGCVALGMAVKAVHAIALAGTI
ncbi:sulfite exporter TauE/SafE family protein [Paraburkholderia sacchari]|uniref:sulfite exporter TauE/SafE family protein n=1 Tax=Paraburkholderia sacchari TaxID=159450 RepID=UPI00054234CF|nr:sulfite exporter TauE/SafE family protein [Paraburkholderia sacchari]NLP61604.1 sulfite exporter TauE/SafE family protein [Paraburkholderia sacchari]